MSETCTGCGVGLLADEKFNGVNPCWRCLVASLEQRHSALKEAAQRVLDSEDGHGGGSSEVSTSALAAVRALLAKEQS